MTTHTDSPIVLQIFHSPSPPLHTILKAERNPDHEFMIFHAQFCVHYTIRLHYLILLHMYMYINLQSLIVMFTSLLLLILHVGNGGEKVVRTFVSSSINSSTT